MYSITWTFILIILSLFIYIYMNVARKLRFWAEQGIPHKKPRPFLGNLNPSSLLRFSILDVMKEFYSDFRDEKYVGMYLYTKPSLLVIHPELVERIMVRDFHHFTDHDRPIEDKKTILSLGLFNLRGNEWKALRHKLAPTFTSGKLKTMFDELLPCGDDLIKIVDSGEKECRDLKDVVATYTMDVTARVIFGIEIKNIKLRDEYRKHSDNLFSIKRFTSIIIMFAVMFPKLANFFRFRIVDKKTEDFFRNIVTQTFKQRRKCGAVKNDYVQLLLKLKEQGYMEMKLKEPEDEYLNLEESSTSQNIVLTEELLVAQAFQFLTTGIDDLQSTMVCLLFELAYNETLQNKVRKEINDVVSKNNGYTYQALKEMTYLDQCINESLRKYPSVPFLPRLCTKSYRVDKRLTLEKGTSIMIPLISLHKDPNYFPDPERFDPERFNPDATRKNFTYLPFGAGPRICIGMRFAFMEMKLAVVKVIERYSLKVNPKTKVPLEMNTLRFFLTPKNVYFDLTPIK